MQDVYSGVCDAVCNAVCNDGRTSADASCHGDFVGAVYLAGRVVHAASYILGITVIRSAAFYAGTIATLVIAAQLQFHP